MATCWTLYNLGLQPEIQEEVHKELDSIFEGDTSRPITREDLCRMKYLECVIKVASKMKKQFSMELVAENLLYLFVHKRTGHREKTE